MNTQYFDRYQYFEENGSFKIVPGIELPIKTTDKYYQFKKGKDRLDKLSDEYYGTPFFGWLIMLGNPLAGSMDFEIPDKVSFTSDNVNLLQLKSHFYRFDIVGSPHGDLWRQLYYGNNFERAFQPFQITFRVNDQYAGCTDYFIKFQDVFTIAFSHIPILIS